MKKTSAVKNNKNPVTISGKPYKLTKTGKTRKQIPLGRPVGPRKKAYRMSGPGQGLLAFGKRLYELRYAMGTSLREFEKISKINNSKLAKIENGQLNITMLTFLQICGALNMSPKEFWDY